MDDWENEDFEPTIPTGGTATDKWQGEDEDDDVKDNWEDEDAEEKKEEGTTQPTAYQRPKKKSLAERIAEKERLKQTQEGEKKEEIVEVTPEQKLAEKIRLQKVQEEADLKLAKGLFGVDGSSASGGIDNMYPETKEGFDRLEEALKSKITFFEGSKCYTAFAEKLIHDVALTLPVEDIKKIGIALNSLYHEKERQRKEQAKNKKKKAKASIKVEKDDLGLADETTGGAYYEDDDDFI